MNETLAHQEVLSHLKQHLGDTLLSHEINLDFLVIEVSPERIVEVLAWLKNDPKLKFNFLTDLCGVHFPENIGKELGVVYHLHSFTNNYRIRVKAFIAVEKPELPSVCGVFSTANWMERETFDFFGIVFTGHPNLKRILNVDHMEIFPLRKEYPLEDTTREDKDDRFFGR